tara:strand:- start:316 stop:549 length:234 start_codon:yes stop_codon:yes gene_type:complete
MENNFQRFVITGDKKLQEAKYNCIELLYTNGREDLIDTLLSLNGSNKMNNEIEELQSIVAKNGRPDLLKLIESSIIT